MTMPSARDLVGLDAFSRDGDKIGKVKDVVGCAESDAECLVIKCGFFRDLVVPADVIEKQDAGITIPFAHSFLDVAPRVASKGTLSSQETARLRQFFRPRTS
jgi:ribosomal 30S subunit maturation factor RimM